MKRSISIVLAVIAAGCSLNVNRSGPQVAIERKTAERHREVALGGVSRPVSIEVNMEYPSKYGIPQDEYVRLTAFVDEMLNDGTNFESSVASIEKDVFDALGQLSKNANAEFQPSYKFDFSGAVNYQDGRYFSYELNLHGTRFEHVRSVFDRKLRRVVKIEDLVSSNNLPSVRRLIAKQAKLMGIEIDEGFPQDLNGFGFYDGGVIWDFKGEAVGVQTGWVEITVEWNRLSEFMKDQAMIPTGRFGAYAACATTGESDDWWNFPYEKYERYENEPPGYRSTRTEDPLGSAQYKLEIPARGCMSADKYAALQAFLGKAIAQGENCESILDGVGILRHNFWAKCLGERKADGEDGGYDVLELQGRISYRGPKYVSYTITHQQGCPCCAGEKNVVWSWDFKRGVDVSEIIDMRFTGELKNLIRNRVKKDFADYYADSPELVLPDYAKNWPEKFDNFRIDANGITWTVDAGDVLMGGKGPCDVRLLWDELKPMLINGRFDLK